ncbi:MAG: RNA polymerase sigma factor RpoD/SigA [Mangrovibacterium sp.]
MRQLKITHRITNKGSDSLDKYLHEVSKEELVDIALEIELAQKIHQGDTKALDKLVRSNLRFVVSVAKQYQGNGLPLPDLINEGNLGLIKAAERFDETKGFKFISYAVWWIRQSIIQAISNQGRLVRLPANKSAMVKRIKRTSSELEQELEREPSAEEIAEALDSSSELAQDLMRVAKHPLSMDAPLGDDASQNMYDTLKSDSKTQPDDDLMDKSLHDEIMRLLSSLDERGAEIIILYFGLNGERARSLEEIAKLLNITKERVRQLRDHSLRRLKIKSSRDLLRDYLD